MQKQRLTVENLYTSVFFNECIYIMCNKISAHLLCASIFIEYIWCYLVGIGRLNNAERHVYVCSHEKLNLELQIYLQTHSKTSGLKD